MRIRDVLATGVFLVVAVGFGAFASWYWGGVDWQARLEQYGIRTGSAPFVPALTVPSVPALAVAVADASPTPRPSPTAQPAPAAYCSPGQSPRFVLGFADLKKQIGAPMGDPIECEHTNPDNGDSLQQTTTGLAVFRKQDGRLNFTDGWNHWALTPEGMVTWQGDAEPQAARPGG